MRFIKTLNEARIIIDDIDKQMAKLFEERMRAVEEVVLYKIENDLAVLDNSREKQVIEKNTKYISNSEYVTYYQKYLQALMDISKTYQRTFLKKQKIGYQGTMGAYSHIATTKLFPYDEFYAYISFDKVFEALSLEEIDYGVIPFENSYTGEIGDALDLLRKYPHIYIRELYDLKIDHSLLGIKGSTKSDIKEVYSHSQALSQCNLFLSGMSVKLVAYPNTALAAKYVSETNDKSMGVIASKDTATLYNLEVLEEAINTSKDNTTRFMVISNKLNDGGNRFNLLFTVNHDVGSLAKIMQIIANLGFNMESIKSRSIPDVPWSYYFYVEIVGNINSNEAKQLIKEMAQHCLDLRVIGAFIMQKR